MKVVLIGTGNVATHLGSAIADADYSVVQVYGRTEDNAKQLAGKLHTTYTSNLSAITSDADIYLFAVKDDCIEELARKVKEALDNQNTLSTPTFIHTSGSTSIDCLKFSTDNCGVIYPLQTFSKARKVDFHRVPLFVEGSNQETEDIIMKLAWTISDRVVKMDSQQRRMMHLAAVWACNFVNHCYNVADGIMQQCNLPFELLLPLIDETAAKVHDLTPREAQTGPAVRYDKRIIDLHLNLLKEQPQLADIYERLSRGIRDLAQLENQ